jgi:hypothetical protein
VRDASKVTHASTTSERVFAPLEQFPLLFPAIANRERYKAKSHNCYGHCFPNLSGCKGFFLKICFIFWMVLGFGMQGFALARQLQVFYHLNRASRPVPAFFFSH